MPPAPATCCDVLHVERGIGNWSLTWCVCTGTVHPWPCWVLVMATTKTAASTLLYVDTLSLLLPCVCLCTESAGWCPQSPISPCDRCPWWTTRTCSLASTVRSTGGGPRRRPTAPPPLPLLRTAPGLRSPRRMKGLSCARWLRVARVVGAARGRGACCVVPGVHCAVRASLRASVVSLAWSS
jgi:hypothetical protein